MNVVKATRRGPRPRTKRPRRWGYPASFLTDNGLIFTTRAPPGGAGAVEARALRPRHRGQALPALPPPDLRQGRALPPDLKKFLAAQEASTTKKQLQRPARPLRRLLQRRATAPGHRAQDTPLGLRAHGRRPGHRRRIDKVGDRRLRLDRVDDGGRSRCATEGGCTTSGSVVPMPAGASPCSSTASTSRSSASTAHRCAASSSTRPRTTSACPDGRPAPWSTMS